MKRAITQIFTLLLLVTLAVPAFAWMDSLKHFTGKVSPENQKGMPMSFFIKTGKKEITAFVQKASMLKIGMSEQEVLKLLGSL